MRILRIAHAASVLLAAGIAVAQQQPIKPLATAPQPAAAPKPEPLQLGPLKIIAVEGEGAINSIRMRRATPPVVEVRDQKDKPVEGAEVVFVLPPAGASGAFHGWMRNQTARTDSNGRATVTGYAPNDEEGRFNIKVTASAPGYTAGTLIVGQSNARGGGGGAQMKSSRRGLWTVLAIAGAGGIIGGAVAARGNGGTTTTTTTTTPVTITAGPITVGGPR